MSHNPRQTTRVNFAGWHNPCGIAYEVPDAVDDVWPAVRNTYFPEEDRTGLGNATCIGPDMFISAAHVTSSSGNKGYLKVITPEDFGSGTILNTGRSDCTVQSKDPSLDLAILKTMQHTQINSVKLAEEDAQIGDEVFIHTNHPVDNGSAFEFLKALPAQVVELPDEIQQGLQKQNINTHTLFAIKIDERLRPCFWWPEELSGLSGSAVLNNKGELVGVLVSGGFCASNNTKSKDDDYQIIMGIVKLSEIKKYLTEHEPELAKALGIKTD